MQLWTDDSPTRLKYTKDNALLKGINWFIQVMLINLYNAIYNPWIYSKIDTVTNTLFQQGKVHGSLARAGKVKSSTPKVDKTEKPKKPKGRAYKRLLYTNRFVNAAVAPGGKRKMNSNAA